MPLVTEWARARSIHGVDRAPPLRRRAPSVTAARAGGMAIAMAWLRTAWDPVFVVALGLARLGTILVNLFLKNYSS